MKTLTIKEYQNLYNQTKWRRENGLIKQGKWLDKDIQRDGVFCGCMHGSITQTDEDVFEESSRATGFPLWLSYLTEKIFEGLSHEDAQVFPEQVFKAFIDNPNVCEISHNDFDKKIRVKTEVARMDRLISYTKEDQVLTVIKEVKRLWVNGGTTEEWTAALSAAWAAAEYAKSVRSVRSAESAALSALSAESAALSAVRSALSAESAALSAVRSAAEYAESDYYKLERDSLLCAITIVSTYG